MTTPTTAPASIDPVCGMVAAPDGIRLVHEGVAYSFCEDACAVTFTSDPSRWVHPFEHAPSTCVDADHRTH